ncbi:tape measure protein [Methyloversatilis sp.]|uniref:tape measure protein n=1 Tax=Methyloversatilis sp. TaxID=2569862 RepID=UPI0035B2CD80
MNVSNGDIVFEMKLDDGGFQVTVKDAVRTLRMLKGELDSSAVKVDDLEKNLRRSRSAFRDILISVAAARYALQDLNDIFIALPRKIAETTGEFQRLQMMLKGLSSASTEIERLAEAQTGFNEIIKVAQNAPFEIKNLSDAFVKLKIAGLDPASGSLQTLVDSVAKFGGSSENLQRAAVAIQQMTGKGVISMEELRQQLGEAMPNAMQLMARGMGMSMAELTELVSKGAVRSASALRRMFVQMRIDAEGSAAALMETYPGALSKLKTSIDLFYKDVGNAGFVDVLVNQMSEVSKVIESTTGKTLAQSLGQGLAEATRNVIMFAREVMGYGEEILTLGKIVLAMWGGERIRNGVTQLTNAYQRMREEVRRTQEDEKAANDARIKNVNDQIEKTKTQLEINKAMLDSTQKQGQAERQSRIAAAENARQRTTEVIRAKMDEVARLTALDRQYEAEQERIRRAKKKGARQQIEAIGVERTNIASSIPQLQKEITVLDRSRAALKSHEAALRANAFAGNQMTQAIQRRIASQTSDIQRLQGIVAGYEKVNTAVKGAAGAVMTFGKSLVTSLAFAGAAVLAIEALMWAWDRVTGSAKRAAQEQERAMRIKRGEATEDDFKKATEKREAELSKIRAIDDERMDQYDLVNGLEATNKNGINDARIKTANDKIAALDKKLVDLRANYQGVMVDYERASAAIQRGKIDSEVVSLQRIFDETTKRKTGATETSKQLDSLNSKLNEASKDGRKGEADIFKKQIKELTLKQLEDSERVAAEALDETIKNAAQQGFAADAVERFKREVYDARVAGLAADIKEYKGEPDVGFGKKDGDGAGATKVKEEDPIAKAIARANAQIAEATVGFKNALSGLKTAEGLREEIRTKYQNLVDEGFYPDITKTTTTGKGKNKTTKTETTKVDIGMLQPLIDADFYKAILAEYEGVSDRVRDLSTRVSADFEMATDRLTENPEKLSEPMRQLERDIAKSNAQFLTLIDFIKELEKTDNGKKLVQKLEAAGVTEATLRKKASDDAVRIRQQGRSAEVANFIADNKDETRALVDSLGTQTQQRKAYWDREIKRTENAYKKQISLAEEGSDIRRQLEEQYALRMGALAEMRRREEEGALGEMVRAWQDVQGQLNEASANWGRGFIDMLVDGMEDGKFKVGDFLTSMFKDALKINMQKEYGVVVQGLFGSIQQGFMNAFTGNFSGALNPLASLFGGMFSPDASKENTDAQKKQAEATAIVTQQLSNMGITANTEVVQSLVKQAIAGSAQVSASSTASASMVTLSAAAYSAAAALEAAAVAAGAKGVADGWFDEGGSIGDWFDFGDRGVDGWSDAGGSFMDWFSFAKGGIMSSAGSLPLKKYSMGGIANSPQLALFGEGRMNEAYVPLPDGRSIPVTLTGGGGGAQIVNVQVYEAAGTRASVQQSQGEDGSLNVAVMIEQIEGQIANRISKGKSQVGRVIEGTYGLNRAAGAKR